MYKEQSSCYSQIARPSASRFLHVFQDDNVQVLSVDVSTSTDAVYSGNTLTIITSTSMFRTRMYYLLADSGLCLCMCVRVVICFVHVCACAA